ncbi:MAG: zinc-dependent metalloprotease [Myxococcota bacterium]
MKLLRPVSFLLAIAFALMATACVEDVGLIDRTQANYVAKSSLAGVWYKLEVVTDIPMGAGFGFAGQANFGDDGGKVVFDIQENYLVVYPFSEKVMGGDAKWNKKKIRTYWLEGKEDQFIDLVVGNPTAIYPIKSHFDIQRDYSSTTGSQSNVLVENTTDKPWYKRKYVRVDWMGNALVNGMFPQGSMKYSPVDYYVPQDEKDNPNRFYMDPDGGYFHFTRRVFGQPMSTGACSTYALAPGDCAGAAFDTRVSFKRANPKRINDFEILPYHNAGPQEKFGYFLAERYTFDEEYGLTYAGHDYKAARWNIWKKSKALTPVKDATGKTTTCVTNRDCAAPAVCDQKDWFVPGVCASTARIEYRDRGIRPIVYHVSEGHPVDHLRAAYAAADSWSDTFKETVSWLYFWQDKWAKDNIKGFSDAKSRFGQRFCSTNSDCAGHAPFEVAVDTKNVKANRVVVAVPKGDTDSEAVIVTDCTVTFDSVTKKQICSDRPALGGDGLIVFVNATPGSAAAKLEVKKVADGPVAATVSNIAFAAGELAAKDRSALLPKSSFSGSSGTFDLVVTADGQTAKTQNVKIKANEVTFVVFVGGDSLAVLKGGELKSGLRVVNGLGKKEGTALSQGATLEVGVNGTRFSEGLEFGKATDLLYFTGSVAHVVMLNPGQRADVSCLSENGVGTCVGWRQKLTPQDYADRLTVKDKLQDIFVICENAYTGDKCTAAQRGDKTLLNDCRYWVTDPQTNKPFNPCADLKNGGFVEDAAAMKLIGDMRYNFFYWVTNIHASSPLGYGPSAADPDTGEIVWSTANIYGASLITYAQYAKDLVDLLNGDLDASTIASGRYIKEYLLAQSQTGKDKSLFDGAIGAAEVSTTPEEQLEAARRQATVRMSDRAAEVMSSKPGADDDKLLHELEDHQKLGELMQKFAPTFDMGQVFARLDKIKGTSLERAMVNDEMALVMSEGEVQPGDVINPEMLGKIGPTGWATPKRQLDEKRRMQLLGYNNIYLSEFQDPSLLGLAKRMKCQPGQQPTDVLAKADPIGANACYKGDALRTALSIAIFRGVLEHEVGHTLGLRHNFEASSDLINYFDGYFDPNTGREKEPVLCADLKLPGSTAVIGKDVFCEQDTFGETCALLSCSTTSDCPSGLSCLKSKKQCIDADAIPVGTCQTKVKSTFDCSEDSQCAGGQCIGAKCYARFACTTATAASVCLDGESCEGGYCADARGKTRTAQMTEESVVQALKYVPRAKLTPKEIDNRRVEYQYSSIMDYGQKVHSDIHSLGKYDYAAIKYGYGELVEIYSDPSYLIEATKTYAKNQGRSFEDVSWRLTTETWSGYGTTTPTLDLVNHWMPPEYNVKREAVPTHLVEAERLNVRNYVRQEADSTYFEVPYKYCSDEFRGNMGCYYFDTGSSPEEIVYHAGEAIEEYYLFDAFKRERLWFGRGGSPLSYLARIEDRWLTPIGQAGRYYALFNNIYSVFSDFKQWENSPFGLLQLKRASEDSFRRLSNMITAPAPGSYIKDPVANRYNNVSYEAGKGNLEIPMGVGKMPWTSFATAKGYYYFDHPLWIGGYWDKVAAILTMTNSSANFLSDYVGEQLPLFRGTAIGYNTVYPKQLASLLGGLAAGDVEEIGGHVDTNNVFYRYDPFKPYRGNDPRVEPSILNHSLRLFAAWQAIANLPAGFDPTFTDSMAIWLKGNGQQYDLGKTIVNGVEVKVDVVEFVDPFGKKTYVAPKPNYDAERYSPTHRMLEKLNLLKTGCADGSVCAAAPDTGSPICANGSSCATGTWWTKATGAEKEKIANEMKTEIEVIDYFRELFAVYGSIGI